MPPTGNDHADASELARRAEEVAATMKTGSWDSVQALALVSIAKSLASIASASRPWPTDGH